MLLRLTTAAMTCGLSCVLLLAMPIPESVAEFSADEYASYAARLADTSHDFVKRFRRAESSSGDASERSQAMCIFCHTPEGSPDGVERPLWAPAASMAEFPVFGDGALGRRARGPMLAGNGSLICLGCHDGMFGSDVLMSVLSEHPIGVSYPVDGYSAEFRSVSGRTDDFAFFDKNANGTADIDEIRLVRTGDSYRVECASCHDAHGVENGNWGEAKPRPFLRLSRPIISDVCITCHLK